MNQFLQFAAVHPFLTIIGIIVIGEALSKIIRAIRG